MADSRRATRATKAAQRGTASNLHPLVPVRLFPRPACRVRAVSAAIGRFDHPPSTEVHSNRPLQRVPLLRTTRWRLMEVTPQYVCQPHQPHQPGSHRRSSPPPDSVHRCARRARTHAQLPADCAVGQAAAATLAAPIASTSQQPTAQVWLLSAYCCTRPAHVHAHARPGLRPGCGGPGCSPSLSKWVMISAIMMALPR